jgi:iron complex outermembrane recepter protein
MQKNYLLVLIMVLSPLFMIGQFSLSGKINNLNDNIPLSGAHITLLKTGISTVSDAEGYYLISNILSGTYKLKISYVGMESVIEEITISGDTKKNFLLSTAMILSDEVIISAIRATDESPTTYTVMDQTEIEKNNMGKDLPYILKSTPSVVVTSDAGGGVGYTGMRIRGTDLTGINVTLNGVPVNDGESHSVYFVDLPDLASSINDVQIQRGVGTSTNGAASFGASINIKTGENHIDPHAELSSAVGSFNTLKNTVKFGSGLLNNHWNFSGRLSSVKSDGYVDRASSDLKSAYFSGGYYGKNDILKAIVLLGDEKTYQSWYGIPKDSLETNRTYNPAGEILDEDGNFVGYYDNQTDNYVQNYYQLHYAHQFNEQLNLASTAFLTTGKGYYESYKNGKDFTDYGRPDVIIGGDTITSTNLIQQKWLDNKYYGINLSLNYNTQKLKLNFGGGWNYYDGDHYGKVIWAQYSTIEQQDKNWYYNTGTKSDINFFAKANYSLNSKINLYGDLQYRTINYDIDGTHDDLGDLTQSHDFNFFNPKAGIFYRLNDNQNLYLSVGVANREPNRSVYRDSDTSQNISSERLIDFELGYKYNSKSTVLEANLFYMDYKDQLVMTGKINNVGDAIMTNVPESYRVGIELVAGARFLKIMEWNINTTLSENKIKNFTAYVDNWSSPYLQIPDTLGTTDISFSPGIILSSDLSISPVKNLKLSIFSKFVGRQYIDNTSNKERSLDPYFVNNFNIYYTIETNFIKQIDFMLSLNNIFNTKYESKAWVYRYYEKGAESSSSGYFPQAEFNFMFGVNLKF